MSQAACAPTFADARLCMAFAGVELSFGEEYAGVSRRVQRFVSWLAECAEFSCLNQPMRVPMMDVRGIQPSAGRFRRNGCSTLTGLTTHDRSHGQSVTVHDRIGRRGADEPTGFTPIPGEPTHHCALRPTALRGDKHSRPHHGHSAVDAHSPPKPRFGPLPRNRASDPRLTRDRAAPPPRPRPPAR